MHAVSVLLFQVFMGIISECFKESACMSKEEQKQWLFGMCVFFVFSCTAQSIVEEEKREKA